MTESVPHPYILVGIDGSCSALNALTWAVGEAQLRKLPIRLAHAVDNSGAAVGFNPGASESFFEHLNADALRYLHQARDHAHALDPDVQIVMSRVAGHPLAALVELSTDAVLTTLGSTGLNAFSGLVAGSVSVGFAARGHSPVVVTRTSVPSIDGPIVVGVSGSADAEDAIAWAFDEASLRGADLIAVHVWNDIAPSHIFWGYRPPGPGDETPDTQEERLLAQRLAGWQEKFPDVKVHRVVTTGKPAAVLASQSQHARLVVVGSRGRGDAAGLFLGSTSHSLIHHAMCPVLITRPRSHQTTG
ncbi:universal stress protein [Mycobacterium sp. 852013-50091_SCH5140682]|uniref:universal stress protein n=1 Tax=Mycobacterium sp. 852013-50091_SCH5140682 TaxID=1834109 RepID=UPI0007EB8638|nr:universal stress protein [Mycobacterium sp. 852013-50091_SCH5140682]OBC00378.1 universal stress protein [Mycobacterium sp. 852013-50091_SCH5140682]